MIGVFFILKVKPMQHPEKQRAIECALAAPKELRKSVPLSREAHQTINAGRSAVRAVLRGKDARQIAIVGPCSIHDPAAAFEYAVWLKALADQLSRDLVVVMRVYVEKPRTSLGWKGFITDPDLNGSSNVAEGILRARQLYTKIADLGLPTATELLDPLLGEYLSDLVSWGAIGARTAESQTHRELASGAPFPVGIKNTTDGNVEAAANGAQAASRPHRFLGVDEHGQVAVVTTAGNSDAHIVLRGGSEGPNHSKESVALAGNLLGARRLRKNVIVDCSHGNRQALDTGQSQALESAARQIEAGSPVLRGVMIESNLVGGRQDLGELPLTYGQSITDPCADLGSTEAMLRRLAKARACAETATSNQRAQQLS